MADKQSTDAGLRELALFAGAGGGILGGKLLGWRTVCAVERDAYAAQVLAQRQNDGILRPFPIWSDVCSFDGKPWRGIVDVVSGGFPCQAFSSAAAGRNNAADLWPEMLRVIKDIMPKFVFAENVSEKAVIKAAKQLNGAGYVTKCAKVSASDLGADHIRERYWIFAYSNMQSQLFSALNAEMASLPIFQASIWETYPNESRMADGVAYWMDKLRAIGNGQVPAVAATAWRLLS